MSRCRRIGTLTLLALTLVLAAAAVPGTAGAATRPNIFFYNLDDLRDKVPGGIDPLDHMPLTRAWMADGTRYANMFVADPSCCPSRSSLMTGRNPHNNGVLIQADGPKFDWPHSMNCYLQAAGYRTYLAGKFLTTWPRDKRPPCFTHDTVIWGGYWDVGARKDGVWETLNGYSTTRLGERGREYVADGVASGQPFYLYETPHAPHVVEVKQPDGTTKDLAEPNTPDLDYDVGPCAGAEEADRLDKPAYVRWVNLTTPYTQMLCESQVRAIREADRQFDATMRQLQALGVLDNTLVIFSSDNGYLWGEHNRVTKFVPYEPSIRVPLLVRWPGMFPAGTDTTRMTSYLDLMPTILQAAGITKPVGSPALDGESLLKASRRTKMYSEYFLDTANGFIPSWRMIRASTYKYIVNYNQDGTVNFEEYYNLVKDPTELNNVLYGPKANINIPPALHDKLRNALNQMATCAGSNCVS